MKSEIDTNKTQEFLRPQNSLRSNYFFHRIPGWR